jgi:sterol 3beta-glucosyltransferase
MKVFMLVYGTRGDVQPYLGLATGLARAGHEVVLAGPAPFHSLSTSYGIRYVKLDTGMLRGFDSQEMREAVGRNLKGLAAVKALRESAIKASQCIRPVLDATWDAASEFGAEIVVHHPLGFAGHHVAEKLGVPGVVGQIYPMFVPTSEFANTAYHYRALKRLPGFLNRATYPLFRRMLQTFAGKEIDNWRRDGLDLPPRPDRHDPLRRPDGGPAPVLNAISPSVVPPPSDYPDSVHTTGYWTLPAQDGWAPPAALTDFLDAGPPPVYLGFGSLIGDPSRTGRIVLDAIRAAGVRAIVATGRGGLDASDASSASEASNGSEVSDAPRDVFVLDQAPHDWLLPRMAAVVHHGGGTTVEAARAGRPQVVCPFVIDQVFWGDRMHRLGVAPRPILQRKLTAPGLAAAIREAVENPELERRAADLGKRVRSEDGVAEAVRVLESKLAA